MEHFIRIVKVILKVRRHKNYAKYYFIIFHSYYTRTTCKSFSMCFWRAMKQLFNKKRSEPTDHERWVEQMFREGEEEWSLLPDEIWAGEGPPPETGKVKERPILKTWSHDPDDTRYIVYSCIN